MKNHRIHLFIRLVFWHSSFCRQRAGFQRLMEIAFMNCSNSRLDAANMTWNAIIGWDWWYEISRCPAIDDCGECIINVLIHINSNISYRFQCRQCGDTYLGRAESQPRHRMAEHIQACVRKLMTHAPQSTSDVHCKITQPQRTPQSSIARHLLTSNHQSAPMTAFHVIPAESNCRLLQFMKAIAIERWSLPCADRRNGLSRWPCLGEVDIY